MEKSPVHLVRRETGEAVEAELWDDIADEHVELWRAHWKPQMDDVRQRMIRDKVPRSDWPQDFHWDWEKKTSWSRELLSFSRFALTCERKLQGLMLLNLTKIQVTGRAPSQKGKDLLYVEFLSTAPWNRPGFIKQPVFRGVGLNLMYSAVAVSRAEGFRGRVALHALRQAAEFYRDACGMTDFGPDATHDNLIYFEMTEAQAKAFQSRIK